MCTDPRVVHSGDEGPWDVHGVTKFVTRVTLRVRGGGLLVRGAGIERKPLQEKGSPGGRRRRRIPGRGTYRETQSPGGPGSSRQRSTPGGRTRAGARLGGRNPCDARKEAIPPQPARHRQTGKPQSKPGPPGDVIVRGCAAGVCRTVGGGQGDGSHGTNGPLMPGPVALAAGTGKETPANSRMQHPTTATPSPADKNCHPIRNPSHKLSVAGWRAWGRIRGEISRCKKNCWQNNRL